MLNNFIYAKTKDLFLKELEAGNVLDEAIVFIEDTKEIWNHGTYFDGKSVDVSNIEESINNILNNKGIIQAVDTSEELDDVETNTYVKYVAQTLTDALKQQVRKNIGVGENIDLSGYATKEELNSKQDKLVSGTNIKTINGTSILGSGDITISSGEVGTVNWKDIQGKPLINTSSIDLAPEIGTIRFGDSFSLRDTYGNNFRIYMDGSKDRIITINNDSVFAIKDDLTNKQDTLVSGSNIKTINGESILGEGDLIIEAGFSNANVQAVDTTEILDDIETNTYVKYVAQTLTEEQKAQVRENIGVNSSNNIDLTNYVKKEELSNYHTKSEIDALLGDINTILESIINN